MLSQVTFTAERELKRQALAKARREGLPLKTLLVYALKGFVAGSIKFNLIANESEPEIEELKFNDSDLNAKAAQLAKLLQ